MLRRYFLCALATTPLLLGCAPFRPATSPTDPSTQGGPELEASAETPAPLDRGVDLGKNPSPADWNELRSALSEAREDLRGLRFDVKDHGARGDATTNDTAAIQAAIDAATSRSTTGATVFFPPGTYVMGKITVPSSNNLTITGSGAILKLTGREARFDLVGTLQGLTIEGLAFVGDGTVASAQSAVGCNSGQTLKDIRYLNNRVTGTTVGLSVNADLGGSLQDVLIQGNSVFGVVGTESGTGYGIHVAAGQGETRPMNLRVLGNTVVGAGRHSIYVAKGWGAVIANNTIRDHRKGVATGDFRAAVTACRGGDILISTNIFEDCYDSCVGVSGGLVGVKNVAVEGNIFARPGNAVPMVWVGADNPAIDRNAEYVSIRGNSFRLPPSVTVDPLRIRSGRHISISGNTFDIASAVQAITLNGSLDGKGAATFTQDIRIEGNRISVRGANGSGIRLQPDFCTSSARLELVRNRIDAAYPVDSAIPVTNPNLYLDGQAGGTGLRLAPGVHVRSLPSAAGTTESFGRSVPASGSWGRGDRVWNTAPSPGAPLGWVCVVSGTPGTWSAMLDLAP